MLSSDIENWYSKYSKFILKKLVKNGKSVEQAEDILHNIVIRAYDSNKSFQEINMVNQTKWTTIDFLNLEKKYIYENLDDQEELADPELDLEFNFLKTELNKLLRAGFDALREQRSSGKRKDAGVTDQQIFIKRFIQDKEYGEISLELGLNEKSVRNRAATTFNIIINAIKAKIGE